MKKALILAAFAAMAVGAYAQGTITFNNRLAGVVIAPIYAPEPGNPTQRISGNTSAGLVPGTAVYTGTGLLGANYTAELWGGATSDPATFTLGTLKGVSGNASTTFKTSAASAGLVIVPAADAQFASMAPGATGFFQVRVWDNTTGSSYDSATIKGYSDVFSTGPLGGPNSPNPDITSPVLVGMQSFNLTVVPEPATIAMLALGLGGLLMVRRRN